MLGVDARGRELEGEPIIAYVPTGYHKCVGKRRDASACVVNTYSVRT